jgi:peptidoglycan/LPS O-acetylase OafA/YrhL
MDQVEKLKSDEYNHRFAYADAFRAIAIVGVILAHTLPSIHVGNAIIHSGTFANMFVDTFFMLSGYLLCKPFFRAIIKQTDFPDIGNFFKKRALRIYPAYIVAVLLSAPFSVYGLNPIAFIATHLSFIHGFIPNEITANNVPLWTMAVDVQFYLALPAISYIVYKLVAHLPIRHRELSVYATMIAAMLISFIWRYFANQVMPHADRTMDPSAYPNLYMRNFIGLAGCFALGGIIALVEEPFSRASLAVKNATLTVAVFSYIVVAAIYAGAFQYFTSAAVVEFQSTLAVSLLYLSLADGRFGWINSFVHSRAIKLVAELSYSLYLVHWVVIIFITKFLFPIIPSNHIPSMFWHVSLMLAFTLPISILINKFVERPFLMVKKSMSQSSSSSS